MLILAAIVLGLLWTFLDPEREPPVAKTHPLPVVVPEMVPLVTGKEETALIFTRAGCPVCHRIPGIAGAGPAALRCGSAPAARNGCVIHCIGARRGPFTNTSSSRCSNPASSWHPATRSRRCRRGTAQN